GVVTYSAPVGSLHSMLQAADRLMYQAKQAGGDRLVGGVRSAESVSDQQVELADLIADPH
ncbi:MAG: hypothetical protein MUP13_17560, partial [Thermoanaerobaculales bacterium]|nr:hypothetical protein [Thermoanaerobaculales bacterium]